jgi:hypothetical protein
VIARVNRGLVGEDIIQPGLGDHEPVCRKDQGDVVADLTEYVPIDFNLDNLVDAAIAQIRAGRVDAGGSILDIGSLSANTLNASLELYVQKSGRTSGHTVGKVTAVDVTANVSYPKKCGSRGGPTARFVNQFRITPGGFSTSGDSGSLIVENVGTNPRAVGLLFAGSSTSTLANRIQNVLCEFSAPLAMAGGTPSCVAEPAVNVVLSTDKTEYLSGTDTTATLTAVVTDETAAAISGLNSTAFVTTLDGASASVTFSETASPGTYTGDLNIVGLAVGSHTAEVTVTDTSNVSGSDSATFSIVSETPLPGGTGTIAGKVTNSADSMPIEGARVKVDTGQTAKTDAAGNYAITDVPTGNHSVKASAKHLESQTKPAIVDEGLTTQLDFALNLRVKGSSRAALDHASDVKTRHSEKLFAIPGVVGHGVGLSETGMPVIEVYLEQENAAARARVPAALDKVPVRVVVTGAFEAF